MNPPRSSKNNNQILQPSNRKNINSCPAGSSSNVQNIQNNYYFYNPTQNLTVQCPDNNQFLDQNHQYSHTFLGVNNNHNHNYKDNYNYNEMRF